VAHRGFLAGRGRRVQFEDDDRLHPIARTSLFHRGELECFGAAAV
jgi:hypothetical protein